MTIRRALGPAVLMAAIPAVGPSPAAAQPCEPARPGVPRTLFERVPIVMSAQMAATRDGGVVIAFSSYDGTADFPDANFTVLALDSSGCTRWRTSLRGRFLARPIQPDPRLIVVASGTISGEPLRIYKLLGFGGAGSFLGATPPAVRVGAGGRVVIGFASGEAFMCANATRAGRFGRPQPIAVGSAADSDLPAMLFGPAGSGTIVASTSAGTGLLRVDAGCDPGGQEPLDPDTGVPQQAAIDARGRTWVLGQPRRVADVGVPEDLRLTIVG